MSRPDLLEVGCGKVLGGQPDACSVIDLWISTSNPRGVYYYGFDLVPALISRRVDAVVGADWTHENIMLENQGHPVHIMRMEEWGVPDYYELVLVTNESTIKASPR